MSTHPHPHATASLDEPIEAIPVEIDDDAEPEAASPPPASYVGSSN